MNADLWAEIKRLHDIGDVPALLPNSELEAVWQLRPLAFYRRWNWGQSPTGPLLRVLTVQLEAGEGEVAVERKDLADFTLVH